MQRLTRRDRCRTGRTAHAVAAPRTPRRAAKPLCDVSLYASRCSGRAARVHLHGKNPSLSSAHCHQKCLPTGHIFALSCLSRLAETSKKSGKYRIDSVACPCTKNDLIEQSHGERPTNQWQNRIWRLVTPTTEIRTVARHSTPRRPTNAEPANTWHNMSSKSSSRWSAQSPRPPRCAHEVGSAIFNRSIIKASF
jgi:hypothetical protein